MSDSDKSLWQGVEQKPTDELKSIDGGFFKDIVFSVFIPEADHSALKVCDARVGYGHPVSIACDVLEDMLRLFNRFYCQNLRPDIKLILLHNRSGSSKCFRLLILRNQKL